VLSGFAAPILIDVARLDPYADVETVVILDLKGPRLGIVATGRPMCGVQDPFNGR